MVTKSQNSILRVLFLQDHAITGGAARAANRYAFFLRRLGIHVAQASGDRVLGPNDFLVRGKQPRGWKRVIELIQPSSYRDECRRQRAANTWISIVREFRPDVIWLHNLQGGWKWGWSLPLAEIALQSAPTIWTLHDLWPLTRGSSYLSPEKVSQEYEDSPVCRISCKNSPNRLVLTAPSLWVKKISTNVQPAPDCVHLPYPLDTDIFKPNGRQAFRKILGLMPDDFLILAAAENLQDPRKRVDLILAAWQKLPRKIDGNNVFLGLLGRNPPAGGLKENTLAIGSVKNEGEVAGYMAAADLFIHTSEAETFGLVLEEAQACGTPVLAVRVGGVSDTFEEGVSGWGITDTNPKVLVEQIIHILKNKNKLKEMRNAVRLRIVGRHDPHNFRQAWDKIEKKLLVAKESNNRLC